MEKEPLDERLHTQVSKSEKAAIAAAAAADDRSVSAFIRRAVLRELSHQDVTGRAKTQFRNTMASRPRNDEVAPRFKEKK